MDKKQVFDILKANVLSVVPCIDEKKVTPQASLKALGANSMDRAEIIMLTLQSIDVRAPMIDFVDAKNIEDLCKIMAKKKPG